MRSPSGFMDSRALMMAMPEAVKLDCLFLILYCQSVLYGFSRGNGKTHLHFCTFSGKTNPSTLAFDLELNPSTQPGKVTSF